MSGSELNQVHIGHDVVNSVVVSGDNATVNYFAAGRSVSGSSQAVMAVRNTAPLYCNRVMQWGELAQSLENRLPIGSASAPHRLQN